jgi:ribosomal protein S18 acetylase RimI-like enzyme
MSIQGPLTVRSAQQSDHQHLAGLINFEAHVHRHMDWHAPLEWLGRDPFLVIDIDGKVIAALACPPDLPQVAWIRLFAVSREMSPRNAWQQLWSASLQSLDSSSDLIVAVLPLYEWLITLLKNSGFIHTQDVILMMNDLKELPQAPPPNPGCIRSMKASDIPEVTRVDRAAFDQMWGNSQDMLAIAYNQAEFATVAEIDGVVIGYQISTSTSMGGHLARLAVLPDFWGRGVGYGLVFHLIQQYIRRGTRRLTVNTQGDNDASIKLYSRAGFYATGESYPVYSYKVSSSRKTI